MPRVTFLGTGHATAADRPTTSLLYQGARTLLLDCGYSVPRALWAVTRDPDALDAVFVSHLHADHTFGLPNVLLAMRNGGRRRPLTVFGGPGVAPWLERLLDLAYPGSFHPSKCFPIVPTPLAETAPTPFGPLTLRAARSDHKVHNLALRVDDGATAVCFSGDGGPTQATRALYQGATLLVHEAYHDARDVPGHARADQLLPMAASLGVQRLALVHVADEALPAVAARAAAWPGPGRVWLPSAGESVDV